MIISAHELHYITLHLKSCCPRHQQNLVARASAESCDKSETSLPYGSASGPAMGVWPWLDSGVLDFLAFLAALLLAALLPRLLPALGDAASAFLTVLAAVAACLP